MIEVKEQTEQLKLIARHLLGIGVDAGMSSDEIKSHQHDFQQIVDDSDDLFIDDLFNAIEAAKQRDDCYGIRFIYAAFHYDIEIVNRFARFAETLPDSLLNEHLQAIYAAAAASADWKQEGF